MPGETATLTVFAHVHNEAFFLPHWIRHHQQIFDHGVIVDRGSTDDTVEIIRALAPTWDIVESRNPVFDARDCDAEMMDVESRYGGWKIILNATEFLFHDDVRGVLAQHQRHDPEVSMLSIGMAVMADPPELRDTPIDPNIELWRQRTHGVPAPPSSEGLYRRMMHHETHGAYSPGRHVSSRPSVTSPELLILRFAWSPYAHIRKRKLAIQTGIAAADISRAMSFAHLATPEQLDVDFAEAALDTVDLRDHEPYRSIYERMCTTTRPPVTPRSTRLASDVVARARTLVVVGTSRRANALARALGVEQVAVCPADQTVAVITGPDELSTAPHMSARPAPVILDLAAPPSMTLLQTPPRWTRTSHGALSVTETVASADFLIVANAGLLDGWLPYLLESGRVDTATPGGDVLAVVPDHPTISELAGLRAFLAHPVRRGVPPHRDRHITVSESSYRFWRRLALKLLEPPPSAASALPTKGLTMSTSDSTRSMYIDLLRDSLTMALWGGGDGNQLSLPLGQSAADVRDKGLDWPELAYTMIGTRRMRNLQQCVEDVIARGVPGDLIETGVWRGGACIFMRGILKAYGITDRTVWVADSFEGLPPGDAEKYPADAASDFHLFPQLAISQETVADHFSRFGLLDDQVRFLKGFFRDTLPTAPIEKLAILRLDGDMYESTMDGLVNLYDKLSDGGYLIIDDYSIAACRSAVADFRAARGITDFMRVIDWTGVYWRKGSGTPSANPQADLQELASTYNDLFVEYERAAADSIGYFTSLVALRHQVAAERGQ